MRLLTKLNPPIEAQKAFVLRHNLLKRLQYQTKLMLICAGAGYGKSTTALQLLQSQSKPFVWLSLDHNDNNPVTFWSYVAAAYQQHDKNIGADVNEELMLVSQDMLYAAIVSILNNLVEIENPPILLLDDYHVIKNDLIHENVNFFLDRLMPSASVIILSRTRPPLQLSRRRANAELLEITDEELTFDTEETQQLLANMQVTLDQQDLAMLQTVTEGWVAGLKLAILSLTKSPDKHEFVKSFSAHHRDIADYLLDEVFSKQSLDIQQFLLETSYLPRLQSELCNAVTQRSDAEEMLCFLEKNNLFLIPLDNERIWFRYHDLFKELLFERLQQKSTQLNVLRELAAKWFIKHQFIDEALEQIIALKNWNWAVQLVERIGYDVLYQGHFEMLYRWTNLLPSEYVHSRPKLTFSLLGGLGNLNRTDEVLDRLAHAKTLLENVGCHDLDKLQKIGIDSESEYFKLLISIIFGQGVFKQLWYSHYEEASARIQEAEEYIAQAKFANRADITYLKAVDSYIKGNLPEALSLCLYAEQLAKNENNIFILTAIVHLLTWVYYHRGDLQVAIMLNRDIAVWLSKHININLCEFGVFASGPVSIIYRELNDKENCEKYLQKLLHYRNTNPVAIWLQIIISKLEIEYHRCFDSIEKCFERLQVLRDNAAKNIRIGNCLCLASIEAYEAELALQVGDLKSASRWASDQYSSLEKNLEFDVEIDRLILAKILRAEKKYDLSLKIVRDIRQHAEKNQRVRHVVLTYIIETLNFYDQNEIEKAMQAFERALTLAEPCGFIRLFVNEQSIGPLLYLAAQRKITPTYTQRLIDALPNQKKDTSMKKSAESFEQLSQREYEVLVLLSQGLSNKIIAKKLFVSEGTIKTHNHKIFEKLQATSRTEAIAKARVLGLL